MRIREVDDRLAGSQRRSAEAGQRWRTLETLLPVAAPLVLGTLMLVLGQNGRGMLLIAIAAIAGVLVLCGVDVIGVLTRVTHRMIAALTFVVTGLVGVLVASVGAVMRLFGRDILRGDRRRRSTNGTGSWVPSSASSASMSRHLYGIQLTRARGRRSLLGGAWLCVGVALALVGLNYAVGYAWEQLLDPPPAPPAVVDRVGDNSVDHVDPRADTPAMSSYTWSGAYFAEMASIPVTYQPYLNYKPGSFKGRYINVDGWVRRSYEPVGNEPMPEVYFFGGSKIWGEGQRDDFTVPSMVGRLAEQAGIPIRVVNAGQRGFVNFQEMLLFEQLTAGDDRPDLAVFYDGTNDINAQLGAFSGQPTVTNAEEMAEIFSLAVNTAQPPVEPPATDQESIGELFGRVLARYDDRSALHRLVGRRSARSRTSGPDRVGSTEQEKQTEGSADIQGGVRPPDESDVPTVIANTLDIYGRGRAMIDSIAAERGIKTIYFVERQITLSAPEGAPAEQFARYRRVVEGIADAGPDVHDIASALDDHQDTYIDPGHTNEAGAALIAQAMFNQIRPAIEQWYADRL